MVAFLAVCSNYINETPTLRVPYTIIISREILILCNSYFVIRAVKIWGSGFGVPSV